MTIELYNTSSPPNKINKSLKSVRNASGSLRDECSLLKPVIVFSSTALPKFSDVNYMYIPSFGRYYFVDNITSLNTGLIEVEGSIDALYTYKADILKASVVLSRTSKKNYYSKMIPDSHMQIKPVYDIATSFFSNGSSQTNWSLIFASR